MAPGHAPTVNLYYFAYGSNLDADQMRERCPSSRVTRPARLADHRLEFTHRSSRWGGGAADVVSARGSVVWGVVYALHPDDVARLDRFERGYDRIELCVHTPPDAETRAFSYSVHNKGSYRPTRLYRDKMIAWGTRHGLPRDYLEILRAIETLEDSA